LCRGRRCHTCSAACGAGFAHLFAAASCWRRMRGSGLFAGSAIPLFVISSMDCRSVSCFSSLANASADSCQPFRAPRLLLQGRTARADLAHHPRCGWLVASTVQDFLRLSFAAASLSSTVVPTFPETACLAGSFAETPDPADACHIGPLGAPVSRLQLYFLGRGIAPGMPANWSAGNWILLPGFTRVPCLAGERVGIVARIINYQHLQRG